MTECDKASAFRLQLVIARYVYEHKFVHRAKEGISVFLPEAIDYELLDDLLVLMGAHLSDIGLLQNTFSTKTYSF